MKTIQKFTALAGLVIGAVGVQAIHAQAPSQTVGPAFISPSSRSLIPKLSSLIASAWMQRSRPLAAGTWSVAARIASLEGEAPKGRIVVIKFDSTEKAKAWYDSPAYQR
jgi:Domain of unknown function (DUF1330)